MTFQIANSLSLMAFTLALAFTVGCSESVQPVEEKTASIEQKGEVAKKAAKKAKKPPRSPYGIDNLPPETVVLTVNGTGVTQREYEDWLRVKSKLKLLSGKPKAKRFGIDEFTKSVISSRTRVLGELIRCALVRQYAATNNLKPNAEIAAKTKAELDRMWARGKKAFPTPPSEEALRDAGVLATIATMSGLDEVCLRHSTTNDLDHVTDAELDDQIKRIAEWNVTADKKDAESREKAKKAKAEILAGTPFAEVAKKAAEVAPAEGEEWETFELGEFQADDPLGQWLATAKMGDISDPIEMEDGYSIIGVRRILEGELDDDEKGRPSKQYELVRCTFFAYEKIDPPTDREQLRKDMIAVRRQEAFQTLGTRLTESASVAYPKGTAIFEIAKKKKSPRQKRPALIPSK